MNSLPKTVTRQRRGCDLNPGPTAPESSTLTTRLPSHPLPLYGAHYKQVCVEPRTSALNMTLPAERGARSYRSISAADAPAVVAVVDRWDSETNGRTDGRPTVT